MADTADVTRHYASDSIAERVLAALRAASGPDVAITPETLAPLDQFHGRGLAATKELAKLLAPQAGEHLLDIGCGLGGPARWIAARFGCRFTGIDLTPQFCEAAIALTAATGQLDSVRIMNGSATELPYPDATFDRAYSQNVVMNIADKARFYSEAFRVVKPGGVVAFSNIGMGPNGAPHYPVPWASTAATSFLATSEETRGQIEAAGFKILSLNDPTAAVLPDLMAFRAKIERDGLPKLGTHAFMGERMLELQANSTRNLAEGRTALIEVLVQKPA
ncbi:MAG: class I SAM-dependent methyltransferase [Hyphomicrobiaceae bacterium]